MGAIQSSRLYFNENDHKDIFYKKRYHKAMYKGDILVWQQLGGKMKKYQDIVGTEYGIACIVKTNMKDDPNGHFDASFFETVSPSGETIEYRNGITEYYYPDEIISCGNYAASYIKGNGLGRTLHVNNVLTGECIKIIQCDRDLGIVAGNVVSYYTHCPVVIDSKADIYYLSGGQNGNVGSSSVYLGYNGISTEITSLLPGITPPKYDMPGRGMARYGFFTNWEGKCYYMYSIRYESKHYNLGSDVLDYYQHDVHVMRIENGSITEIGNFYAWWKSNTYERYHDIEVECSPDMPNTAWGEDQFTKSFLFYPYVIGYSSYGAQVVIYNLDDGSWTIAHPNRKPGNLTKFKNGYLEYTYARSKLDGDYIYTYYLYYTEDFITFRKLWEKIYDGVVSIAVSGDVVYIAEHRLNSEIERIFL